MVLADGSVIECNDHHHEDLFWALRGAGGGNFAVVTSLVFETVPAPDATSFHLIWPYTRAAATIGAWQSWSPAAPDEMAASLLLTARGDPERPPVVNVFGAMLGTESDTEELLEEMVVRVGRTRRRCPSTLRPTAKRSGTWPNTAPATIGRTGTSSTSPSSSAGRCEDPCRAVGRCCSRPSARWPWRRSTWTGASAAIPYAAMADGVTELRARGMPLGAMPGMTYEENEAHLDPGDSVLLHSDGLVEAHGHAGEMFGFPRLQKVVENSGGGEHLIDECLAELRGFVERDWEQEDGITLEVIQRGRR